MSTGRRGLILGTGGHVDHGKTTLVRALTGIETDRWAEERERGLTIDIGFASLDLGEDLEVGVVDVPGHEDFLRNMLAGATGIDLLLLAVAADEGPMPQTHEHLAIAALLGVRRGVVAVTKRDRVDHEWLELALDATRDAVRESGLGADWPLVPVSSVTGEGLEELVAALAAEAGELAPRQAEDLFRMPIDRAFTIRGTGTVVTGTVWSGSVSSGDALRLLPEDRQVRVRGLESHGEARERIEAGRRCAVALVGVDPEQAGRGATLVADPAWRPYDRLGVRLRLLARPGRSVEPGQRVRVFLGTAEAMARVFPEEGGTVAPGESAWAILALERPLAVRVGDRAIVRFYSPVTTIGGARIAELDPPRRWQGRRAGWERILEGSARERLEAAIELAGARGLSREESPVRAGMPPSRLEAEAAGSSAVLLGGRWFTPEAREETMAEALEALASLHRAHRRAGAVSREALRSRLARSCDPALADDALERLAAGGEIVARGPSVALPDHRPELTGAEREALDRVRDTLLKAGLQPPTVSDLAASIGLERHLLDDLLRLLSDAGETRPITPEIHVSARSLDGMSARVRELLSESDEPRPPTVFKEEFGLSRKYLIPLLEYLDRSAVTRRTGEGRVLAG